MAPRRRHEPSVAAIALCVGLCHGFTIKFDSPTPLRKKGDQDYAVGDVVHPLPLPLTVAAPPGSPESRNGAEEASTDGVLVTLDVNANDVAEAVLQHSQVHQAQPSSEPLGTSVSLFMQLFTVSYAAPISAAETWFKETNAPSPHNPLRFTAIFDTYFKSEYNGLIRDEHGDSCVGMPLRAELCLQALSCLPLGSEGIPGGELRLWLPTLVATNYRFEAFVAASECDPGSQVLPVEPGDLARMRRLIEVPIKELVPGQTGTTLIKDQLPTRARHLEFRVRFAEEASSWWAKNVDDRGELELAESWMEMMEAVLQLAQPWTQMDALWMEFGVASGKSLTFIASKLQKTAPHVMIHGFDSFEGIQQGWSKYTVNSFSMEGRPPEILEGMKNVELHTGYFDKTLRDLDKFAGQPVAFIHMDVDLFASCREVLAYLRCRLVPGTVIVFDEWFNYRGWHRDGEYRAWHMFAAESGIQWRPLGIFFEQSVGIAIESTARGCGRMPM